MAVKKDPRAWQLSRCRNKVVLGTWEEEATLHVSLRDRAACEDPLHIPLFSDLLPFHCMPHIGVYSPEDYSIAVPRAIITLPAASILSNAHASPFTALPVDLQETLLHKPSLLPSLQQAIPPSLLEAAIVIHSRPSLEVSLQPEVREVNLMLHTWAFRDFQLLSQSSHDHSPHVTVEMGVFGGLGVRETAQDVCEELNGVPVGRMGPRILYMHDMSFSPHNCQLALQSGIPLHAFFSLTKHPATGLVLTYHILPSCEVFDSRIKRALCDATTVGDLVHHLHTLAPDFPQLEHILPTLNILIAA